MKSKKNGSSDGVGCSGDKQKPAVPSLKAVPETHQAAETASKWLKGEGEMACRIREFDWSATPIGPIESWPQSLRTASNLCLASRFQLIIFWTRDLVQMYNDAFLTILGNKHPSALGQTARECWAEMWDLIEPLYEHVFQTGTATWTEQIQLPVQRHGYLEESFYTMSYTPIFLEDGNVGGVFNVVIETTLQVVAERRTQTLRDLAARTAESQKVEEACRIAVEVLAASADIPFAILYLLDPDGETLLLAGVVGLEPGEPVAPCEINVKVAGGWPVSEAIHSRQVQSVNDVLARFGHIQGGPWGHPVQTSLVLPLVRPGGAMPYGVLVAGATPQRAMDVDFKAFLDLVAGQVTTAVGNARAYEEEQARAAALAELDRAKTAFFSNVSHEFRTPLTLMLGPVEDLLLRSHTDLPPAAKGQLEVVNRNGLRLLRLVNTLLDFSRIEAGRVQAVFESTDLSAFTTELASVFRAATERAGLTLTVNCPSLPEPVYVDRDMWEKIVLNLVSNAFKFTFEGDIEVKLRAESSFAILTVRDTGVGIPAEEMPRIFERFHRVQNMRSRTHEGSGIGLALVHELVKLHGGSIRAESTLGAGAAFIVTVPLGNKHLPPDRLGGSRNLASTAVGAAPFVEEALRWLPEADQIEETIQPDSRHELMPITCPPGEADDCSGRPRIIIADDNTDMRYYLARLLSERYNVATVQDGQAALAAARERRPELILSDVMMPLLDGFGLVRELRADSDLKTIPIILLSARAGEESRVEGLQQGADDYLIKPFSARELLARVAAHLEMARMRKEATKKIQQSEERLALAASATQIGMFDWDLAKGSVLWTQTHESIFGYAPAATTTTNNTNTTTTTEHHYSRWADRVHPEDLPLVEEESRRCMQDRKPLEVQYRIIWPDGSLHWVETRGIFQHDSDGKASRMLGVVMDITERKQAEDALRESERTQRLLAQIGEIGTRLPQSGEMIEAIGECVAKELGVSRCGFSRVDLGAGQVTVLKDYHSHLPALTGVYPMNGYADYLEEGLAGRTVAFEDTATDPRTARVYATNYAPIQVRAHLTVPLLRGGEWVANFWISHHEPRHWTATEVKAMTLIADRVWLAIERQRVDEDLRKSEERLRLLIDGARDYAIFMLDVDGRVTSWNEGARRLKGWDAQEILGRHLSEFYTKEAVAARHPEQALKIAEAEGRYEEEGWRVRKDGSKFMAEVIITAIHDEAGNVLGFAKITRDITERKRAEERIAHLATFPQLNPNAILELDSSGGITFFNPATVKILETLGMDEADITAFLPLDMNDILESWDRLNEVTLYREIVIKERAFSESIFLAPQFNVARIYAFDITELKRVEERLAADLTALSRVHALSRKVLEASELEPLLQEIMDAAITIMKAEKGTLQLVEGDSLRIVAHHGHDQPFLNFFASAETVASVCGEATKRAERVVVDDVESSPIFAGTPSLSILREGGVRAVQSTPLISHQGELLGILTTQWGVPHVPDELDLWRIDLLARQATDMIEQTRAEKALRESEQRFRSVVENMSEGLMLFDARGIIYQNPASLRIHGYNVPGELRIEHKELPTTWEGWDETGRSLPFEEWPVSRVLRHERFQDQVLRAVRVETGHEFYGSYNGFPILGPDGTLTIGFITIRDITKRKQAEEDRQRLLATVQSERDRLSALVNSITDEIWFSDAEKKVTLVNPAVWKEFGSGIGDAKEVERIAASFEVYRPDGTPRPVDEAPPLRALRGETVTAQEEIVRTPATGQLRYRQVNAAPVRNPEGAIIGSVSVVRDITERKQAEEALRETRDYLENLFIYANAPIIVWDPSFRITRFNQAFERLTGLKADDVIGKTLDILFPGKSRGEAMGLIQNALSGERLETVEIPILHIDGSVRTVLWNSANIHDRDNERVVATIAQGQDITERNQAEQAIKASLHEKEVLLKEVHHRVKNNMQVISSLVSLQADGSKDETVREVLKDVTYRVRSMALVHEKLYQSTDLARIDFAEYARSLLGYLWRSHGAAAANVRLSFDMEPVLLPVDAGVPCGLILNELGGNALKHAFRGRSEGEVTVALQNDVDGHIRLSVSDNGVGLPPGFDWREAGSLGLHLVKMLSKQLRASVEVSGGNGTRFEIVFQIMAEGRKGQEVG